MNPERKKSYIDAVKKEQGDININDSADKPENRIITDPFGSWTGVPADDKFDLPVQDVDDL